MVIIVVDDENGDVVESTVGARIVSVGRAEREKYGDNNGSGYRGRAESPASDLLLPW